VSTLPPVREWRLHLGVHKTATTHIQYRLEALRAPLAEAGLDVMVPESGVRRLALNRIAERAPKLWRLRHCDTARLTDKLDSMRHGPDRIIVSEELMLGRLETSLYGRFYDQFAYMASLLGALGKTAPVHLFLCIRSLDTFLPSSYAQVVRHRPPPPGRFEDVRHAAATYPMRWSDVVAMLRKHAPAAQLKVWRYEDYRANADRILAEICGVPSLPEMPEIAPPNRTKSGSTAAVAAASALPESLSPKERKAQVSKLYADPALAGSPFDPFSPQEKARLRALYEEDWNRILRAAPEAVLHLG
jgi:hypothetical protein